MATLIQVPTIKDQRGSLSVIDGHLPFSIKRVFTIYNVSTKRGGHRHIDNRMALIALGGSVEIFIQTPTEDSIFKLTSPDEVLLVEPEDWHTMDNFTEGSTLLVLCSHSWSNEDYIFEPYREIK